jgi:anti-sigma regulatory factor (Ser/Thr protein kinase)
MSADAAGQRTTRGAVAADPCADDTLSHQALVYASDAEFLSAALPHLRSAVERAEPGLAVTTPERIALLAEALGGAASTVEYVSSTDWHQIPAWTLGAAHRLLRRHADSGRRLWMLTELDWSRWTADETVEWQRYESILNVALSSAAASVICAYDSRAVAARVVHGVEETHPTLVQGDRTAYSTRYMQPADYTAAQQVPVQPAPKDAETFEFDVRFLSTIRHWSAAWAEAHGMTADGVRDLLIAVHEVASNAIEHGGGAGIARFWATPTALCCEVSSSAPLRQRFPGYLPPDTNSERGRGLWMARQICTRVDVVSHEGDGVDVRLAIARDNAQTDAPDASTT